MRVPTPIATVQPLEPARRLFPKSAERPAACPRDISLLNRFVCSERDFHSGLQSIDYVAELNLFLEGKQKGNH